MRPVPAEKISRSIQRTLLRHRVRLHGQIVGMITRMVYDRLSTLPLATVAESLREHLYVERNVVGLRRLRRMRLVCGEAAGSNQIAISPMEIAVLYEIRDKLQGELEAAPWYEQRRIRDQIAALDRAIDWI